MPRASPEGPRAACSGIIQEERSSTLSIVDNRNYFFHFCKKAKDKNIRIKNLIYGLPSPKFGAFSSNHSTCQNIERAVKNTEVYGGFYQSEISQIMKDFSEVRREKFDGNRY